MSQRVYTSFICVRAKTEDTLMDLPFLYAFYVIVNMSDIHVMKSVLF